MKHKNSDKWSDEKDPNNRKLLGWKAWYADGSVYDSSTTQWKDLPQMGLQVVKCYYRNFDAIGTDKEFNWEIQTGWPLYCLNENERDRYKLPKTIKCGQWVDMQTYHEIYDGSINDKEFIDKMI